MVIFDPFGKHFIIVLRYIFAQVIAKAQFIRKCINLVYEVKFTKRGAVFQNLDFSSFLKITLDNLRMFSNRKRNPVFLRGVSLRRINPQEAPFPWVKIRYFSKFKMSRCLTIKYKVL